LIHRRIRVCVCAYHDYACRMPVELARICTQESLDAALYICDVDDDIPVTAFAPAGVDNSKELVEFHKANRQARSRD
jgi:hypothetical protein